MRFSNPEVESIILRKYRAPSELRGVTTQKAVLFVVTAVKEPIMVRFPAAARDILSNTMFRRADRSV
jgi:hypothetical protein